jgi:hypothetical protein
VAGIVRPQGAFLGTTGCLDPLRPKNFAGTVHHERRFLIVVAMKDSWSNRTAGNGEHSGLQ